MEISQLASKEFLLQVPKIKINNNSATAEGCSNWYCENHIQPIYKIQKYGNSHNIMPFSKPFLTEPYCASVGSMYNYCSWPAFANIIF